MDGPTISQPCIDFEPDERWHIKEEGSSSKQEAAVTKSSAGGKEDSLTLSSSGESMQSKSPLGEVNGSAFECQGGGPQDGGLPKVNGELEQPQHDSDVATPPCLMETDTPSKPDDSQKSSSDEAKEESQPETAAESSNSQSEEKMEVDEAEEKQGDKPSDLPVPETQSNSAQDGTQKEGTDPSEKEKREENKIETKSPSNLSPPSETTAKQEPAKPSSEKPPESKTETAVGDNGEESAILALNPGFPSFFEGAVKLGGYKPAKNIQKELKLEDDEALLEAPSFVMPLLIKKSNVICTKMDGEDAKKENSEEDKEKEKGYFGKSIGKFLIGLGLSRASECYQRDMTRVKLWQLKKEGKSDYLEEELAMHKNAYSQARIANEPFKFKNKKCEFCDFQTESILVMDHHYSIPHLNFRKEYKCNYCTYMSRDPKSILFHFEAMHGRRAILDLPIQFYQCPFCSFETHLKTKASSHINKCQKFYAPGRNQLPSADFPYPALTAKPLTIQEIKVFEMATAKAAQAQTRSSSQYVSKRGRRPGQANMVAPLAQGNKYMSRSSSSLPLYHQLASQALTNMDYNSSIMQKPKGNVTASGSTSIHFPPGLIITKSNKPIAPADQAKVYSGRGSSQNSSVPLKRPLPSSTSLSYVNSDGSKGNKMQGSQAALYSSLTAGGLEITPTTANSNKPNISIHPAGSTKGMANPPPPKLQGPFIPGQRVPQSKHTTLQGNSYVICEICDAYIKDLEQLRSHMQSSHKIKIHPKMLANRPPLNCQKCHWRFFTDQGLERHLLGAHGLVTSNMQDMANKNQDGGRCTICGGIFACKLVAHMSRVHKVTLKPAHLSYKCTVCSTTFILYRLFENHVYTVHSGGNKRPAPDDASPTAAPPAKKKNVQPQQPPPKPSTSTESLSSTSAINKIKLGNSISITVINKETEAGGATLASSVTPATAVKVQQQQQPAQDVEEEEEEEETKPIQRCSDCGKDTDDILQHRKDNHLKKCLVKLCRIEKCAKCLNSFDGMVVLHTSDLGLEDDEEDDDDDDEDEEESVDESSAISNKDESSPVEDK